MASTIKIQVDDELKTRSEINCIIQKASREDAAEILEYLKKIGGETDNLTFGAEGVAVTSEEEAVYISRIKESEDEIMLVAKIDGKIVGDASLSRLPRRMNHRGELGIAVIKQYWNKGIGSQLLKRILSWAKEKKFEVIELQVRSDNLVAIHLYEKYGFQRIGSHPAFFKINNEYVSFDYMILKMDERK